MPRHFVPTRVLVAGMACLVAVVSLARAYSEAAMPTDLTPYAALVWLCVGFFTGLGWAVAALLVARLAR